MVSPESLPQGAYSVINVYQICKSLAWGCFHEKMTPIFTLLTTIFWGNFATQYLP